ncbi:MAG: rRNA pseudouridine synthase [Clostridia bacterium]|nr:rRNA pseudouridine synthase [Clostridia bacterium]
MRLDRLLSTLGYGSRKEVQRFIHAGAVTIAEQVIRDPGFDYRCGEVLLNGRPVDTRLHRTLMMNKPVGVLTAARDHQQPTVVDLLEPCYLSLRCMPVGRLDKDTEGLLLFTTDGELSHRLQSPRHEIDKVYWARVDTALSGLDQERFSAGIDLGDFVAKPSKLTLLSPYTCQITVSEGKFHQVRRMLKARGHETLSLKRLSVGPIRLDETLKPGAYRELTESEALSLYQAVHLEKD